VLLHKDNTSQKGTVCDDEFTDRSASLICQEMGYACAKGHYLQRPSSTLQAGMDIVLDNIKCGNVSTAFEECSYVTGHNCVHSEDVFLTCSEFTF
jgi:deleted-in-malignant-brain-tumors protein 1